MGKVRICNATADVAFTARLTQDAAKCVSKRRRPWTIALSIEAFTVPRPC